MTRLDLRPLARPDLRLQFPDIEILLLFTTLEQDLASPGGFHVELEIGNRFASKIDEIHD